MIRLFILAAISGLVLAASEIWPILAYARVLVLVPYFILSRDFKIGPRLVGLILMMLLWQLGFLYLGSSQLVWLHLAIFALWAISKDFLGWQRAYIAFLFMFLSAEGLPYFLSSLSGYNVHFVAPFYDLAAMEKWQRFAGLMVSSTWLMLSNILLYIWWRKFYGEWNFKVSIGRLIIALAITILPPMFLAVDSLKPIALPNAANGTEDFMSSDGFLARMAFFISFFMMLFAIVKAILPNKKLADD